MALKINLFSEWLLMAVTLCALFVSVMRRKKEYLFPLQVYIVVSLLNDLLVKFLDHTANHTNHTELISAVMNSYSFFEFTIFYYFIFKFLASRALKNITFILYCFYISFCLLFWISNPNAFKTLISPLFAIEDLLITVLCIFYFYELLKTKTQIDLHANANFIAISGILFYFSTSLPLYLSHHLLFSFSINLVFISNSINYIMYSILFIAFMKAYLCPYQEQRLF